MGRRAVPAEQTRNYDAGQIASLGGLSRDLVEQLTAFGLLDCHEELYGFRDLASARQLAQLFACGVRLSTIVASPYRDPKVAPEAALSNLRLYPSASDALLVEHGQELHRQNRPVHSSGRRGREDPDALFEQAQSAEEANDSETAKRLYQKVMQIDPSEPTAGFNLGNLLRAGGQKLEAEVAYRSSTKADPDLPSLGIIWRTCSMNRAKPTWRSPASNARWTRSRIMRMRSSISVC
jgi:tetratricopeptide (TPR) repeat protein